MTTSEITLLTIKLTRLMYNLEITTLQEANDYADGNTIYQSISKSTVKKIYTSIIDA